MEAVSETVSETQISDFYAHPLGGQMSLVQRDLGKSSGPEEPSPGDGGGPRDWGEVM